MYGHSSIGTIISYAIETTKGVRPTTGYIILPGLQDVPLDEGSINSEDDTSFEDKEGTSSIILLPEGSSAIEISANASDELRKTWTKMYSDYIAATKEGRKAWWCVDVPEFNEAEYMTFQPAPYGKFGVGTNARIPKTLRITVGSKTIYDAKPTYAEDENE